MKIHRGCGRAVDEVSTKPLRYRCDEHGDIQWFEVTHNSHNSTPTMASLREQREASAPQRRSA